jgi:hypothetical protein
MTRLISFFAFEIGVGGGGSVYIMRSSEWLRTVQMEYLSRFNGNAGARVRDQQKMGKSHLPRGKGGPTLNLYLAVYVFIKIDFHNK